MTADFLDGLQRMFIENILINTGNFPRIEITKARIKIKGNDWSLFVNQQGFGMLKKIRAIKQIRLPIGLTHQSVITGIFPAGAVVAAFAQKHIEEGIGVVVIADPTGG